MGIWILIIYTQMSMKGEALDHIEFSSEQACYKAADDIKAKLEKGLWSYTYTFTTCEEK